MKRQEQHAQLLTLETGAHRERSPSAEARESQAEAGHHVRPRCSDQRSNRVVLRARSASLADTRAEAPALFARSRETSRQRAILASRQRSVPLELPRQRVSESREPPQGKLGRRRSIEPISRCARVIA